MPTRIRCRAWMADPFALFVYLKWKARSKFERNRDEVRRCLHVRLGHLPSRMVAGVRRLRLREVRQVARRERRRDRRHGEHDKAKRKETCYARAMCGSHHGTTSDNKNPASLGDASFSWRIGLSGAIPSSVCFPRGAISPTFLLTIPECTTIAKE
jgi:hypothetical protein